MTCPKVNFLIPIRYCWFMPQSITVNIPSAVAVTVPPVPKNSSLFHTTRLLVYMLSFGGKYYSYLYFFFKWSFRSIIYIVFQTTPYNYSLYQRVMVLLLPKHYFARTYPTSSNWPPWNSYTNIFSSTSYLPISLLLSKITNWLFQMNLSTSLIMSFVLLTQHCTMTVAFFSVQC